MLELPTPSAKTVMSSQSNRLSTYFEAKQNRRRKAIRRQKRLEVGLPAAVPLKHVSLDQKQREAISTMEAIGTAKRKRLFVTRHFAWPVSLGLHLFAAFLLTLYAITEYTPEEVPVFLDFVEPIREPRRITRKPVTSVKPPKSVRIQATRVQRSTPAAVEIPTEEARFYTPSEDLIDVGDAPTAGGVSIPEGLGNIQVQQQRAEIPTETPGVKIDRSASIAPEDSEIDIPDAGLGNRDIEVVVQVDQRPGILRRVEPKYPEAARRANKEDVVILEFTVDVNGKATDIKVMEPKGFGFDEAAIAAVKRWRFTPAKKDNKAVAQRVQQKIRFTLDD